VSVPDLTNAQQRNVDLVRRLMVLSSDGRSGLEKLAKQASTFFHPEIEWSPALLPQGKSLYTGLDEYRAYLEEAAGRRAEGSYLNVQEVRPVDPDRVMMLAWVHYDAGDGVRYDGEYALLAGFEDGLIRRLTAFATFAEAEKAASDA
jgi:ketosteroid isomerase-like protein